METEREEEDQRKEEEWEKTREQARLKVEREMQDKAREKANADELFKIQCKMKILLSKGKKDEARQVEQELREKEMQIEKEKEEMERGQGNLTAMEERHAEEAPIETDGDKSEQQTLNAMETEREAGSMMFDDQPCLEEVAAVAPLDAPTPLTAPCAVDPAGAALAALIAQACPPPVASFSAPPPPEPLEEQMQQQTMPPLPPDPELEPQTQPQQGDQEAEQEGPVAGEDPGLLAYGAETPPPVVPNLITPEMQGLISEVMQDAQTPPALQTVVSLLLDVTTRAQMQLQLQSDAQHAAQQEHLKTKEALEALQEGQKEVQDRTTAVEENVVSCLALANSGEKNGKKEKASNHLAIADDDDKAKLEDDEEEEEKAVDQDLLALDNIQEANDMDIAATEQEEKHQRDAREEEVCFVFTVSGKKKQSKTVTIPQKAFETWQKFESPCGCHYSILYGKKTDGLGCLFGPDGLALHFSVMVSGAPSTKQSLRILMSGDAHATSFKCRGCLKQMMGRLNDSQEVNIEECAFVSCLWVRATDKPEKGMQLVTDAIVLHASLQKFHKDIKKVLLVTEEVKAVKGFSILTVLWDVRVIEPVQVHPSRLGRAESRFKGVFNKLRVFQLEFSRVLLLDLDMVVTKRITDLFGQMAPAAVFRGHNDKSVGKTRPWDTYFKNDELTYGINAGLMLLRPDKQEFNQMQTELLQEVKSGTSGPEQDYLSERYAGKWKGLDVCNNFQPHQLAHLQSMDNADCNRAVTPKDDVRVWHFSGPLMPRDWLFQGERNWKDKAEFKKDLLDRWTKGHPAELRDNWREVLLYGADVWWNTWESAWSDLEVLDVCQKYRKFATDKDIRECPACGKPDGFDHFYFDCEHNSAPDLRNILREQLVEDHDKKTRAMLNAKNFTFVLEFVHDLLEDRFSTVQEALEDVSQEEQEEDKPKAPQPSRSTGAQAKKVPRGSAGRTLGMRAPIGTPPNKRKGTRPLATPQKPRPPQHPQPRLGTFRHKRNFASSRTSPTQKERRTQSDVVHSQYGPGVAKKEYPRPSTKGAAAVPTQGPGVPKALAPMQGPSAPKVQSPMQGHAMPPASTAGGPPPKAWQPVKREAQDAQGGAELKRQRTGSFATEWHAAATKAHTKAAPQQPLLKPSIPPQRADQECATSRHQTIEAEERWNADSRWPQSTSGWKGAATATPARSSTEPQPNEHGQRNGRSSYTFPPKHSGHVKSESKEGYQSNQRQNGYASYQGQSHQSHDQKQSGGHYQGQKSRDQRQSSFSSKQRQSYQQEPKKKQSESDTADVSKLKKDFHREIRKVHPDKNSDPDATARTAEMLLKYKADLKKALDQKEKQERQMQTRQYRQQPKARGPPASSAKITPIRTTQTPQVIPMGSPGRPIGAPMQ